MFSKKNILILVLVSIVNFNNISHGMEKIIFDTDFGMFSDDAYALALLSNSGRTEILGATVVPGNIWLEEGVAYLLRFLDIINRPDISVVPGVIEPLMGSRQYALGTEELLWGNLQYLGAYERPEPTSYNNLGKYSGEPYGGYSKNKPFYGPNYGASIGYGNRRQRDIENKEGFPIGTQKVKIVFEINTNKFWDLFISLVQK